MRGRTAFNLPYVSAWALLLASPAAAVELHETVRFAKPAPTIVDEFGFAVAIRDGEVLITARSDGSGATVPGWVRTWIAQGLVWTRFDRFDASDGGAGKRFGEAIAASGDYAIVGSPRNDDFGEISGSAYIYLRSGTGWSQQAKLVSGDPAAFDEFGIAVAIDGDEAMIGSRSDDDGGSQSGSVYVFRRNGTTWPQEQKLVASDDATKDLFGSAIAIDGSYTIIGAPGDDTNIGSAYVFLRSGATWAEQDKLIAGDRAASDVFGTSVALAGSVAAIGAPGDDGNIGAVYIFERGGVTWAETGKITLVGGVAGDEFGDAVAMLGEQLLVGAPGVSSGQGAAFLLERSGGTWVLLADYNASDGAAGDRFGDSVAFDATHALIGAPNDGGGAGSAYLVDVIELDCNANGIPDVCDTSCLPFDPVTGVSCGSTQGCGTFTDCNVNTIPDICETDCNSNGIADACDIAGGEPDCNTNGIPDTCETDCNSNGIADDCDIASAASNDCNANDVPDECELVADERLLSVDFESGGLPAGWSAGGLWHVTDQCVSGVPCDGANWAYFGIDGACDFDTGAIVAGELAAPAAYIPPAVNRATLRYCSNYDGDRGTSPDGFDAAWITVNGDIVDDISGTVASGFWETREVDLSAYAGQSVEIVWHFDSNDALLNNRLGWQLDRIEFVIDSDCDDNGTLDVCDIASAAADDCNSNGVPDTCDLEFGDSDDCNSNALPDECESSADCDTNGIADICETAIVFVDAAATGADDGTSWLDAFADLQDALTRADELCIDVEIWVAAGTYTPAASGGARTATFELRDRVAIYGGFTGMETARDARDPDPATNATVLSGDLDGGGPSGNSYHVVTASTVDGSAVLDGFTVSDGFANGANPDDRGAALVAVNASPAIANCNFTDSSAVAGAIAINGGGPTFDTCAFIDNSSQFGGGVYVEGGGSPSFTACRFLGNVATAGGGGGAMFITATSAPTLENCLFSGNTSADNGGALYVQTSSTPSLVNCTLTNNLANLSGGGVYAAFNSSVVAINSIFWENADAGGNDESGQLAASNSTLAVRYSCVQGLTGGLGGIGNIATDPLFADPDGVDDTAGTLDDDVSLAPLSPCIDAGSNGVVTSATDLVGLTRRIDDLSTPDTGFGNAPIVDLGAIEFQSDCNTNGVADSVDIATAVSNDCNNNFIPDECEIDPAGGALGGPYHCATGCDPDCNNNGVPDACDIAAGTSSDCAGEGVPDECEADCNSNAIADSCDLFAGTSGDCNANTIPDDCELAERDCDNNGRVDECELAQPFVTVNSGQLSPVDGSVLSFIVPEAREAIGDAVLTFLAIGDFGHVSESLEVRINGNIIGTVFDTGASDCPVFPNQDQLVVPVADFNAMLTGGDALIEMIPTAAVDLIVGCDSYVSAAIQYLAFQDCDANGIPDACDPDCNANGVADACDITAGTSSDCNGNGAPDNCDIIAGTSLDDNTSGIPDDCELDCDLNGVPDECDVACENTVVATGASCGVTFPATCGFALDCDANIVPDLCDPDCDIDGFVDACAIAAGTALDCNFNDVPDDCDLALGDSDDCDANAVPDECEPDTDSDGLLDACDTCPTDPAKTAPGACGCGNSDVDTDSDGVAGCLDECPGTAPAEPVDAVGCPLFGACCLGLGQCLEPLDRDTCELAPPEGINGTYQGNGSTCASDRDNDLTPDCDDGCPDDPAKIDPGDCGCGLVDDDADGDGVAVCVDLCPDTAGGETVDSNGCHLYGACCSPSDTCIENTFIDQAFCDELTWTYQGNGSTCALDCAPRALGDYDADGDVDLDDFHAFTDCAGMPVQAAEYLPPTALCQLVFDIDTDGDIDMQDYHMIQTMLSP